MSIISEVGQNFCGDIDLAKKMILLSRDNGAGLVKFQLFDSMKLYGEPGHNELSFEQAKELFDFGRDNNIEVFFSVFDTNRVRWCEKIGVKRYKIAARWNKDELLRSAIISTNKPCYMSFEGGYAPVPSNWKKMWCVSKYPAQLSELHLPEPYFGYSDHTVGLSACKVAIARGMSPVEKHFCVDHNTGVDAPWSMTPDELRELVEWEKTCQTALR